MTTIQELAVQFDAFVAAMTKLADVALASQGKMSAADQAALDRLFEKIVAGTELMNAAIAKLTPAVETAQPL